MFVVVVTLSVDPADGPEFLTAIAENARRTVQDEPGCLGFEVVQLDEPGRYLLVERYRSAEDFQTHRGTPHLAQWREVAARIVVPGSQQIVSGPVVADGAG